MVQFLRSFHGHGANHALRWMQTTVKRCAWAISRRELRHPALILSTTDAAEHEDEVLAALDDGPGPAEIVFRREDHGQTLRAFAGLKPDQRSALIMLGLGCSYGEICGCRGWTHTKTNRCIAEGRSAVRKAERS